MAGIRLIAQTADVSTGTNKKTVLQVIAAANHRVKVLEWSVSFDGISNTAHPILVEVANQSSAGGGGDALTCQKIDDDTGETIQTTALSDIDGSASPTEDFVLQRENVHPQGGYTWQAPFGGELIVNGGDRIGIAVTAAASVNVVARMIIEE